MTIPYYAEGPGPAREVTPLIDLGGRLRYEPSGRLALTTVTFERLTPVTALGAWLDPDRSVIDEDLLYPPGVDPHQEERRSLSQMIQLLLEEVLKQRGLWPPQKPEGGS